MKLADYYLELARDLSVEEPKAPKDIYKMHLIENRHCMILIIYYLNWIILIWIFILVANMKVDSAKQNLADTFVNAFVNVGFRKDTLLLDSDGPGK